MYFDNEIVGLAKCAVIWSEKIAATREICTGAVYN